MAKFQKGHKFAKGGKREGAGRPPNWYRVEADKLLHDRGLLKRVADMAEGKPILDKAMAAINGKIFNTKVAADGSTQVYAFKELADRAWGKAIQSIDVEHTINEAVFERLERARTNAR